MQSVADPAQSGSATGCISPQQPSAEGSATPCRLNNEKKNNSEQRQQQQRRTSTTEILAFAFASDVPPPTPDEPIGDIKNQETLRALPIDHVQRYQDAAIRHAGDFLQPRFQSIRDVLSDPSLTSQLLRQNMVDVAMRADKAKK